MHNYDVMGNVDLTLGSVDVAGGVELYVSQRKPDFATGVDVPMTPFSQTNVIVTRQWSGCRSDVCQSN